MKRALLYITYMVIAATGCKKTKQTNGGHIPAPFTGCRIVQVNETTKNQYNEVDGVTTTFYYNDDGTLSKITTVPRSGVDKYEKDFVYGSNYVLVNTVFEGESTPSARDSLMLDAQGRIIYIERYSYNGSLPHNLVWDTYQYDSLGEMTYHIAHSYNTTTSENYQWRNGDLQWNTVGNSVYTYVYDTVAYNSGNINARIYDLEHYGRSIYVTRHTPVLNLINKSDTIAYSYTTDNAGKITGIIQTQPGNYVITSQIVYACE